jgi:hypothetical protein
MLYTISSLGRFVAGSAGDTAGGGDTIRGSCGPTPAENSSGLAGANAVFRIPGLITGTDDDCGGEMI